MYGMVNINVCQSFDDSNHLLLPFPNMRTSKAHEDGVLNLTLAGTVLYQTVNGIDVIVSVFFSCSHPVVL